MYVRWKVKKVFSSMPKIAFLCIVKSSSYGLEEKHNTCICKWSAEIYYLAGLLKITFIYAHIVFIEQYYT